MSAPCPVLGFYVRATVRGPDIERDRERLARSFHDLLRSHELSATEASGNPLQWSVYRDGTQATHADRQIVLDWSARWTAWADVWVSDIVDLNPAA